MYPQGISEIGRSEVSENVYMVIYSTDRRQFEHIYTA